MIEWSQKPEHLQWAGAALGVTFDPDQSSWLANVGRDLEAVVVFTRFSPFNCEMSIATNGGRTWATRPFLRACYGYAFNQLGLRRVTVVIEEDNSPSLELCRRLGHVEEGRLKGWFGAKSGVLMRMLREECRWI